MVQEGIIHHTILRSGKGRIFYAIIGFIFAAVEMYIASLSYFFPVYRQVFAYVIEPTFFVFLALVLFFHKNINKTSMILMVLLLAVCACGIIATIFNNGSIIRSLAWTMSLLLIPVFFTALGPNLSISTVKGISIYCRIYLILYLISVIMFRERGMYLPDESDGARNYYFLGHVNSSIKLALPALSVFAIVDLWTRKKIRISTWVFILLTLAAQFYTASYVAAVGMCIYIIILFVFSQKKQLAARFPKWLPLAVSGVFFALIILIQRSVLQYAVMFATLFDRTGSVSVRGLIWNKGLAAIEENRIGYGPFCDYSRMIRVGTYFPSSAHNLYIDAAVQTGIFGAVLFVVLLFLLIKNMPSWERWPVIPATLFAYAIMWNFEPYFVDFHLQCVLLLLYLMFSLPVKKEIDLIPVR